MSEEKVRARELTRRQALWKLASLKPGHPEAVPLVAILERISIEEHNDAVFEPALTLDIVSLSVPTRRSSSGKEIVRESDIQQPWRGRFLQASSGSTRLVEGFYANDWKNFLLEWAAEVQHLEAHIAAISNRSNE